MARQLPPLNALKAFEDGRSGKVSANVKIRDAKTYPALQEAA